FFLSLRGLLGLSPACLGLRPIKLEVLLELADHDVVRDDDAHFAAALGLEAAEALAADEGALAGADHGAHVQALARERLSADVPLGFDAADDLHLHASLDAFADDPKHRIVTDLRVVDEELLSCALDESGQALPRVFGADDEARVRRRVGLPLEVCFEQLHRFVDELVILRHDAEAPAFFHIEAREIEAVNVEDPAVDDHHLAVVTNQVVGGPRHGN